MARRTHASAVSDCILSAVIYQNLCMYWQKCGRLHHLSANPPSDINITLNSLQTLIAWAIRRTKSSTSRAFTINILFLRLSCRMSQLILIGGRCGPHLRKTKATTIRTFEQSRRTRAIPDGIPMIEDRASRCYCQKCLSAILTLMKKAWRRI